MSAPVLLIGERAVDLDGDAARWREAADVVGCGLAIAPPDEAETILGGTTPRGLLATGTSGARIAARIAATHGLPWHVPEAIHVATTPLAWRGRLLAAGVEVPWFVTLPAGTHPGAVADRLGFPCLVGPAHALAAGRTERADDSAALEAAVARLRAAAGSEAVGSPEFGAGDLLIEGVPDGRRLMLDGVLERGALRVLALFGGERTVAADGTVLRGLTWSSPPPMEAAEQRQVASVAARALHAVGLTHGPVRVRMAAEGESVRLQAIHPWVVGGVLSDTLRFATATREGITVQELLLRHAIGESLDGYGRGVDALKVTPL
jgi:hypothetical protein